MSQAVKCLILLAVVALLFVTELFPWQLLQRQARFPAAC